MKVVSHRITIPNLFPSGIGAPTELLKKERFTYLYSKYTIEDKIVITRACNIGDSRL